MKKSVRDKKEFDQLARAQARADMAWRSTQEAERSWIAAAKLRKPEAWRRAIDGIVDKAVRVQVANIVWWDHFSKRPNSRSWKHLNDLKDAWRTDHVVANPKSVLAALIAIGYYGRLAFSRVKKNLDMETAVSSGNRRDKKR